MIRIPCNLVRTLLGWTIVIVLVSFPLSCAAADTFELRDYLGHQWQNESVNFPLTAAQLQHARAGHALAGPDGQPVAYQLVPAADGTGTSIEFLVDLAPYEAKSFAFTNKKAAVKTDLKVSETAEALQLVNGATGIRIRKKPAANQGPIERIRLQSGKWVGDSRLTGDLPLAAYTAKVVTRGPVFAEVACTAKLGDASTWEIRFRLNAGEPVVLIDETSAVAGNGAAFQLDLQRDFSPNAIFHRRSYQDGFIFKLLPLQTGKVFTLEPWQNWYLSQIQGSSFSLCTVADPAKGPEGAQSDMLSVGACEASAWVNPDQPKEKPQAPPRAVLTKDDAGLLLTFPLQYGRRKWMISALDAVTSLQQENGRYPTAPLPYQYVIKHGQFPLNTVKDYVLSWDHAKAQYPHLLFTQAEIARVRARLDEKRKEEYLRRIPEIVGQPINAEDPRVPIEAWVVTGDERLARYLATGAEQRIQEAVDTFLVQPVPYGSAPHMTRALGNSMALADTALGTGLLTPEQQERLLARVAFIAYGINRPDHWSPARGYSGNPNMTTSVYGYLNSAACLVNTHPKAAAWSAAAMKELCDRQLQTWSDENGGWLEAPHYAMVSYDAILGALIMANNAGFSDALYTNPRVKMVMSWLGKISTPPDARINGMRHLPCIGNTYIQEPTGEFGLLAYLFREKDPAFAAEMQWMFKQQGSFGSPGIGGGYPAMAGYRSLLIDPTIPDKAPAWKSEWFPQTGVILRSGFPDPRETQLHLIAGAHRDHYDVDSGSITLWGKGRIVADDFGYYGRAPLNDHSMVESPITGGTMQIQRFATFAAFDYVDGLAGNWRRQIVFLKDADPLGPNYFVITDSFAQPQTATWRLWLTATAVTPSPAQPQALATGKEDVDTDIFFTQPAGLALRTEEKTKKAGCGLYPDMNSGPFSTTQIGLIAEVKDCPAITAVIYPRLKTDKAPVFTPIADGCGVKVQHAAGTDYIFISPTPVNFREGDITFTGTVGAVMLRGKRTVLSLGAAGTIAAGGQTLTGDAPKSQEWTAR